MRELTEIVDSRQLPVRRYRLPEKIRIEDPLSPGCFYEDNNLTDEVAERYLILHADRVNQFREHPPDCLREIRGRRLIFISWSGALSLRIAEKLRDLISKVLRSVEVFISKDISTGTLWREEIKVHLTRAKFGVICLTEENREKEWLLFEAGFMFALDKRISPLLIDFDLVRERSPLGQFQSAKLEEESLWHLIKSIDESLGSVEPLHILKETYRARASKYLPAMRACLSSP